MITIGPLADTAAIALNRDPGTVTLVVRSLRDADLLPKGGRGPSAAKQPPLAGARVAIPFLVSDSPKHAVAAVRFFGALPLKSIIRDPSIGPDRLSLTTVFKLPNPHTFEDALTLLIKARTDPDLKEILDENGIENLDGERTFLPMLRVTVYDETLSAEIFFGGTLYTYSDALALGIRHGTGEAPKGDAKYAALLDLPMSRGFGGIRTTRTITWTELTPLAEALAGRPFPSAAEAQERLRVARKERAALSRKPRTPEINLRLLQLGEEVARMTLVLEHRAAAERVAT